MTHAKITDNKWHQLADFKYVIEITKPGYVFKESGTYTYGGYTKKELKDFYKRGIVKE